MPNLSEATPQIIPGEEFPLGDVAQNLLEAAENIYQTFETSDDIEQTAFMMQCIRNAEIENWIQDSEQIDNFNGLNVLHESWANDANANDDIENERARNIANIGTFTTLAFIKNSGLLPTKFDDFNDELSSIGDYDSGMRALFADEAWSHMFEVHNNVFDVLISLVRKMGEVLDIPDTNNAELQLLGAAAALPYLMSYTTSMINQQKESDYSLLELETPEE